MKALSVIVATFGIFSYDLCFNDGQIVRWVGRFLGVA